MTTSEKMMWNHTTSERVGTPPRVRAFLDAYEALCRQHGLCLAHEDGEGAFIVCPVDDDCIEWVCAAHLEGVEEPKP